MTDNYVLVDYSDDLDLSSFYEMAKKHGYENNTSKKVMIDPFRNERRMKAWVLYNNNVPVSTGITHSFDGIFPDESYRICARTCLIPDNTNYKGLFTVKRLICEHQNINDQYFIPAMIDYLGIDKNMYITSNESPIASQRLVHNIYCPTMEKMGLLTNMGEHFYRGHVQTFWKLNPKEFLGHLNKYRWN
mgnify:CR=1 FL=1